MHYLLIWKNSNKVAHVFFFVSQFFLWKWLINVEILQQTIIHLLHLSFVSLRFWGNKTGITCLLLFLFTFMYNSNSTNSFYPISFFLLKVLNPYSSTWYVLWLKWIQQHNPWFGSTTTGFLPSLDSKNQQLFLVSSY